MFDQDDLKLINNGNKINDEKFNEFHKKMFQEMLDQSLFMACSILKKKGERPGVNKFENKISD